MRDNDLDFTIARLGECRVQSPMSGVRFTRDEERVLYHSTLEGIQGWLGTGTAPPAMESAGPRRMLFFDPAKLACGVVTCGGLCPGLNDVISAIVLSLRRHYGVNTIYGFRYGYEGLVRRIGSTPLELTPESVHRIHESGGSILGSSRDQKGMVDYLRTSGRNPLRHRRRTLRGARKIRRTAASAATMVSSVSRDDRQRRVVRAERLDSDGRHRARRATCGERRGGSGPQRDRAGEAHGPRFRIHRSVFGAGQQSGERLPGS
jgi:6-phosphofructokinase 1